MGGFRAIVIPAFVACALGPGAGDLRAQARPPAIRPPPSDTTRQREVVRPNRRRPHQERGFRRDPLPEPTPGVVASAFRDGGARDAIAAARVARWRQDSTLTSYDATVKQRMSAGLNVKAIGRDRLLFRTEVAARVRWSQPDRVFIDVQGARTAVPMSFPGAKALSGFAQLVPIPYFAGSERLMWWMNLDGDEHDDGDDENPFAYVHPLDEGAEHVYEYRSGESATIRLPAGRDIVLREVIVTAREAAPDLINGSLWFDASDGQLVRAAFRPASPLDMMKLIGEDSFDDVPAPVRLSLLTPFTFEVESFTVDYGLYGQRWWLPRSQTARGQMRMGFMRSTASIDQVFRYTEVNGRDSLPAMPAMRRRFEREFGDDVEQIVGGAVDGVVPGDQSDRRRRRGFDCERGDTTTGRQRRGSLRIAIRIPCDSLALVHSPELPPSIFDDGEEEFGLAEARALAKELDATLPSLGVSSQTTQTTLSYGWRNGLMRYNRVEGFSAALLAERPLGRGWNGAGLVRLGWGDLEPNVTLSAARGTDRRRLVVAGYHRLESANDWGDPFGLGGSLSALLFGRDEGLYYRSSGAELVGTRASSPGASVTWRLFGERQHNAPVETHVSLPHAFRGARFDPNVAAVGASEGGLAVRLRGTHGLDPHGFRLLADVRLEGAAGTFDYTRVAGDFTAQQGLVRDMGLSLTLGGGTSGGSVSPQRLWHVGGTHTVRGFGPGTLSGDSYWLARAELGLGGRVFKPVLFYDAAWAGARDVWGTSRGNIRGVGGGVSFMDGLARIDLARGVDPRSVWRAHLYVEAAF